MFSIGTATKVYLVLGITDMRKGRNGLHDMVAGYLKEDPLSGHLFAFANRGRDRVKVLYWDGSGLWICSKRLEKGRFSWPEKSAAEDKVTLSSAEWSMLIGGLDLQMSRRKKWWRKNE
jgi:transposase